MGKPLIRCGWKPQQPWRSSNRRNTKGFGAQKWYNYKTYSRVFILSVHSSNHTYPFRTRVQWIRRFVSLGCGVASLCKWWLMASRQAKQQTSNDVVSYPRRTETCHHHHHHKHQGLDPLISSVYKVTTALQCFFGLLA